jgi:hypothetical protein
LTALFLELVNVDGSALESRAIAALILMFLYLFFFRLIAPAQRYALKDSKHPVLELIAGVGVDAGVEETEFGDGEEGKEQGLAYLAAAFANAHEA